MARDFEYDARGLVKRLRLGNGGWVNVSHDALGRRTSVGRPNGVRSDWTYDDAGQLLAVVYTKAGVDAHGLRVSKRRVDGAAEVYGYDAADRLIRVDESSGRVIQYTLDAVGGGLPTLATTYVYDANGNLTTETAGAALNTYTWDAANRLRQVTQPGGIHQYEYDANGLRTKKTEAGVETRFLLDGHPTGKKRRAEIELAALSERLYKAECNPPVRSQGT